MQAHSGYSIQLDPSHCTQWVRSAASCACDLSWGKGIKIYQSQDCGKERNSKTELTEDSQINATLDQHILECSLTGWAEEPVGCVPRTMARNDQPG